VPARFLPPALDESFEAQEVDDPLDWTYTPHFTMQKDGHSRCFITTAQAKQEGRQHALHLVRELEIQPSGRQHALHLGRELETQPSVMLPKSATNHKPHTARKVKEIRVREADLRKCGPNLELLSQCALPRMEPNMMQMKLSKHQKGASSVPALDHSFEAPLLLPTLLTPASENACRHKTYRRSKTHASLKGASEEDYDKDHHKATISDKGNLRSIIWRSTFKRSYGLGGQSPLGRKPSLLATRNSLLS